MCGGREVRGAPVSVVGRVRGIRAGTGNRVSPLDHSGSDSPGLFL